MRLIDADAIINDLTVGETIMVNSGVLKSQEQLVRNMFEGFKKMINAYPTAKPTTARWIERNRYWVCSNCGSVDFDETDKTAYKYCHGCGAKMEGGENNDSTVH